MIEPGTLFQYTIFDKLIRIFVADLVYIQIDTKTKNNVVLNNNLTFDLDYVEKYFKKLSWEYRDLYSSEKITTKS